MNAQSGAVQDFDQQEHLQVVDSLRGYAIFLVIAVHAIGHVPDLIWPVKRVMLLGFYGVQLFFLASALTLLMSWSRSDDSFLPKSGKFLIRRFFRIAPLYYLAVIFYWFAYQVPPEQFDFKLLISSLLFYNAWSPYLTPTISAWTPVPGGWSISVEFCFYFAFPLLAASITNIQRAVLFFMASVGVMILAHKFGASLYPELDIEERANFLYFWPLNQLPIFALGFLLYHCVKCPSVRQWLANSRISTNAASVLLCMAIIALSFYGPKKFFDWPQREIPTHLIISAFFLGWALTLVAKPTGLTLNKKISGLGKVSFSAYILHFAVLRYTGISLKYIWPFTTSGVASVFYFLFLLAAAVCITRFASGLSYKYIEEPFIDIGKRLIRRIYYQPGGKMER